MKNNHRSRPKAPRSETDQILEYESRQEEFYGKRLETFCRNDPKGYKKIFKGRRVTTKAVEKALRAQMYFQEWLHYCDEHAIVDPRTRRATEEEISNFIVREKIAGKNIPAHYAPHCYSLLKTHEQLWSMLEGFVPTPSTVRLNEVCITLREYRDMGLIYGLAGIGKTTAALHYVISVPQGGPLGTRPVLFVTAPSRATPKSLLSVLADHLDARPYKQTLSEYVYTVLKKLEKSKTGLIVIDEADRLNFDCLEVAREIFDRSACSLLFIGLSGIEHRLRRYQQLHSRIGLVQEFLPLSIKQLGKVLQAFDTMGTYMLTLYDDEGEESKEKSQQLLKEIYRATRGNMRVLRRLLQQAERIAKLNRRYSIDLEIIEAASELILGQV